MLRRLEVHHADKSREEIILNWKNGLITFEVALALINDNSSGYLTLCRACHYSCGHFGDWRDINPQAITVCKQYGKKAT